MNRDYSTFIKEHYKLQKLSIELTNKKYLLLLYDDKYFYYLKNKRFIDLDKIDNILDVINELNNLFNIRISNFYPVCYCNNTVVIAIRIIAVNNSNLEKVRFDELSANYKKLCRFHEDNFSTLYISSNVNQEIKMSEKYINRYKFHEKYIKKYILTKKKRKKEEFYNMLVELIPNKESIIDVSCGDNSDIFKIAKEKKYKLIVGNDIGLNYLKTHNNDSVIYTNDNIENNLIKDSSYDVSFVKNTLHHMNNLLGINNLLDMLDRISNEILIIEVVNPQEKGGLSKFLNTYLYTKFLKDVGQCYLNEYQFKNIINNKFKNHKIEYRKFENILGEFMVAKITKKEK
jgi:hypothetical protein